MLSGLSLGIFYMIPMSTVPLSWKCTQTDCVNLSTYSVQWRSTFAAVNSDHDRCFCSVNFKSGLYFSQKKGLVIAV